MAEPRSISSSDWSLSRRPAIPSGALALDTSLAGARTTGIGLYTSRLAAALAEGPLAGRLWFVGGREEALPASVAHSPARVRFRSLWMAAEAPRLLARHHARLFHGLSNFPLPLQRPGQTRLLLTVHDLIPLTHPDSVSRPFRLQFAAWLARSLQLCDAVVCDSEATRTELAARFPGVGAQVVHLGADHVPSRAEALSSEDLLGGRPYVLYLGALDARKNVGALLKAFEALPGARERALVVVGQAAFGASSLSPEIERLRRAGLDIRTPGHLRADRLWGLLARAAVLCCPSGAEGFGLPPLEGLALGVPVVASRIPAHQEILGDAALFASPGDVAELASALQRALEDSEVARNLRTRGPLRASTFTWRRCAEQTAQVYRAVLGEA
jgi:alpha-1,3-rhamnosyl/mannosyltransferase